MGSKKRFQKPLECALTEQEKQAYAVVLADSCVKKAGLIEEKKAVSSGFNEQIKQLDETVELKSLAIHNGSEIRDVMCDRFAEAAKRENSLCFAIVSKLHFETLVSRTAVNVFNGIRYIQFYNAKIFESRYLVTGEKSLSVMAMIEKHLFNNSVDTLCALSNVLNRSFYKCNLGIPYEFKR